MSQRGWELPPAWGDWEGVGLWQSEGTTEAEPGSGHPHWAGTGGMGHWETQARSICVPLAVLGSLYSTSQSQSYIPSPAGQKPGLEVPAGLLGGPIAGSTGKHKFRQAHRQQAWWPPQTAPAQAARWGRGSCRAPQEVLMWQTLLSASHRTHTKGSRGRPWHLVPRYSRQWG